MDKEDGQQEEVESVQTDGLEASPLTGQQEANEVSDADLPDNPEAMREELQTARQKADDYWDQLLHARADLTNMQRRAERELANAHKYALDRFVRDLLPVYDSLELGLNAAKEPDTDTAKIIEGLEMTLRMFVETLGKFGVSLVDPQGQPFDPAVHQAMTTQPAPEQPNNTVLNVFQKGCLLNDRLVRPATVVVSSGGKNDDAEEHASIDEHA